MIAFGIFQISLTLFSSRDGCKNLKEGGEGRRVEKKGEEEDEIVEGAGVPSFQS